MAGGGANWPASDGETLGLAAGQPRRRAGSRRIGASYSRFVGLMKLILPVIAGVLVLLVVAWPQLEDESGGFRLGPSKISIESAGGQRLVNARYTGTDRRDNPFTITAKAMAQRNKDDDVVELSGPTADIFLDAGTWIAVTAATGIYRKKDQILRLSGGVDLYHDDGYEFHTEAAVVDLADGIASGDRPIRGQGPFGRLRASGFRILDGGERVQFLGKARLLLLPGAGETER